MCTLARRVSALAFLAFAVAGCGDAEPGPVDPGHAPPPWLGTWVVHAVDGVPIPSPIAEQVAGGKLVRTFLRDAELEVASDGNWRASGALEQWSGSDLLSAEVWSDGGGWQRIGSTVRFTTTGGQRFDLEAVTSESLIIASFPLAGEQGRRGILARRTPVPAPLPGTWNATHLGEVPLPATILTFDPVLVDGRWVSVHFVVDSASIVLAPTGAYRHRVRYREMEGEPGGPPTTLRLAYTHVDHGSWTEDAPDTFRLESGWLQGHRMTGHRTRPLDLVLRHGLGHGEDPEPFVYRK